MYKCQVPECGRAFIQLSNLQQHLRSHVSQSERLKNRPFHCAICDRGFATESSMRTHNSKVWIAISVSAEKITEFRYWFRFPIPIPNFGRTLCTTVNKNKKRLMVEPLQLRFVISPMLLQIWQLDKGPATVRNTTFCMDRQIWTLFKKL